MESKRLSYNNVPFISHKDLSYINADSSLRQFYQYETKFSEFEKIIPNRKSSEIDQPFAREQLACTIHQY